jgi:hypothetical protein
MDKIHGTGISEPTYNKIFSNEEINVHGGFTLQRKGRVIGKGGGVVVYIQDMI